MKGRFGWVLFTAFVALQPPVSSALAEAPGQQLSKGARFRDGVSALQRKYEVPAVSAAVYSPVGLEAADAVGVREAGMSATVELSDRFFIASVTKPLTAALAASLVDSGRIKWSTTPGALWPTHAKDMDERLRKVTLAQLLSHKAGVQPFTEDEEIAAAPAFTGSAREQREAFALWMLARSPLFPAGSFHYSNAGFGLAAAMLEKAASRSWEELLRERVFRPLQMTSCGFGWPLPRGAQPRGHVSSAHGFVVGVEEGTSALPLWLAPAGNVHCSMVDLGRFGQAHMIGMLGEPSLLRAESYRAMRSTAEDYVLGWNTDETGYQHLGGITNGWQASVIVAPKSHIAVAIATNARSPGTTDKLMADVAQLAFDLFRYK